jgi:hypothetical protein
MNLSNSPGWDQYRNHLRVQVETRKNAVFFSPCTSQDSVLENEHIKGEGSGIYFTFTFLDLLIEALDEEVSRRDVDLNEEDA